MNTCKVQGCSKAMVVAGPPDNRDSGFCWDHAIAWSNVLSETKPATLIHATGLLPAETEADLEAIIAANDKMMAAVGAVIGRLA